MFHRYKGFIDWDKDIISAGFGLFRKSHILIPMFKMIRQTINSDRITGLYVQKYFLMFNALARMHARDYIRNQKKFS